MDFRIGEHQIVNLWGLNVHMDTILTLWLSMAIVLFFALIATGKTNIIPSKIQAVFENIVTIFQSQFKDLPDKAKTHTSILIALFLLILTSNLIGQVPFKILNLIPGLNLGHLELASPTNDLNVTLALAIAVLFYYIISGVKSKGISYFKHYFTPVWFMTPFNMLEDIIRPLTLSIRLFANILAGEILIMVLGGLIASLLSPESISVWCSEHLGSILPSKFVYNISLFLGSLLPLPIMFFELFVAFIQALVFTLLASAYIQGAISHSE